MPQVIVTDNGTHFSAADLLAWFKSIRGCQLFSPSRHPCSNGQPESMVKLVKTAIRMEDPQNYAALNAVIHNFLLQYRNAVHTVTEKTPAMLFKGRNLRFSVNLDTTDCTFFRGNDSRPCDGLIMGRSGNRIVQVLDRSDGSVHRRHLDQVTISTSPTCSSSSPAGT